MEIDKTHQTLSAYEGDKLVLQTHVSTGKWDKSTPNGHFQAGDKFLMHYSKLFNNAPMPYSVEVNGNVFIHGFTSVPRQPASHGCIRLPLDGDNPAKRFYEWVERGTPIDISGQWEGR
ncbi:MAG: L,D-transpeptidase [Chthoniobacter sp.]|nr:L,D-transpeptidase [Chthoniobacter sp.]